MEIPANARINEAKLSIGPLDDGARVVIFNSSNPSGVAPREGYVLLGDTETADLSTYLKAGETNRIVIQHVDDCSAQGWLGTVELVVDGVGIQQGNKIAHSWGQLKQRYR